MTCIFFYPNNIWNINTHLDSCDLQSTKTLTQKKLVWRNMSFPKIWSDNEHFFFKSSRKLSGGILWNDKKFLCLISPKIYLTCLSCGHVACMSSFWHTLYLVPCSLHLRKVHQGLYWKLTRVVWWSNGGCGVFGRGWRSWRRCRLVCRQMIEGGHSQGRLLLGKKIESRGWMCSGELQTACYGHVVI